MLNLQTKIVTASTYYIYIPVPLFRDFFSDLEMQKYQHAKVPSK